MLKALKRYRKSLGLPARPHVDEDTPLISKVRTTAPVKSVRYIRVLVQDIFDKAIVKLQDDNQIEEADQLAAATVHWLRHTGISDDVKNRPREHVRDHAGHNYPRPLTNTLILSFVNDIYQVRKNGLSLNVCGKAIVTMSDSLFSSLSG